MVNMQCRSFAGVTVICLLLFGCFACCAVASIGDRSAPFSNCRSICLRQNCSLNGINFRPAAADYYQRSIFDKLLLWSCSDECRYHCMWETVAIFSTANMQVPQFNGKWPFVRVLGLQEPASVVFSILNLVEHVRGLLKLKREVKSESPCFKVYLAFGLINLNGWFWSIVFHARDVDITEMLDYAFAYSIVLAQLYCLAMRSTQGYSFILRGLMSTFFFSYYVNYFAYLSMGDFSYTANMTTNIVTGVIGAIGWFIWIFVQRKQCHYYYKNIVKFYLLLAIAMSLELLDFPPIWWVFDSHALWHLATVPIVHFLYSFYCDDCKALLAQKKALLETKVI